MKVNKEGKPWRMMFLFRRLERLSAKPAGRRLSNAFGADERDGHDPALLWYLELRRSDQRLIRFGLGFERLVQFVTGMGNIAM